MNKIGKINISWKQLYICAAFIGFLAFILVYGVQILNPTYDAWISGGGDLEQHYIGWKMYRNGEWKFPIGMMDRLSYPYDVSVIFTDSIPILAVFFKILSPLLPTTFQYFGIWGGSMHGFTGNAVGDDIERVWAYKIADGYWKHNVYNVTSID